MGEIVAEFQLIMLDKLLDEADEELRRLMSGEIRSDRSRNRNHNKLTEIVNCDWHMSALRGRDRGIERMLARVPNVANGERQRDELEVAAAILYKQLSGVFPRAAKSCSR